jgi:hypothetical protein
MALYIPRSIFHLARLLYVRPETFGLTLVYSFLGVLYSVKYCGLCVDHGRPPPLISSSVSVSLEISQNLV